MKIILKIQIFLALIVFGITLTKTVEAAYIRDTSKYTYFTQGNGRCQGNTLLDKYDGFADSCDGAVCTTVFNGNSGKDEVGCFIYEPDSPDPTPAPTPEPIPEPTPRATPRPTVRPTVEPTPRVTPRPTLRPTPPQETPVPCPVKKEDYNQCGGTTGLEDKPSNHTYYIVKYTDCNGVIKRFDPPVDLGNDGQCKGADSGEQSTPAPTPNIPQPTDTPQDNSQPSNPVTTVNYRVASNPVDLQSAPWQPYTPGGVIVSAPSSIFSIDSFLGRKSIYVQFLDSNNQLVKFSNGEEVVIEYISLENSASSEATVAIETSSNIYGVNKIWTPNIVKVDINRFSETGKTLVEVYFRNPIGVCDVNTCGFDGWTKIKSFGTNGFDQFSWTPKPGDVEPGIHMFGVFAVNAQGVADKILSVSPTNYIDNR